MRIVRYFLWCILLVVVVLVWKSLPLLSGYAAKELCSAGFVAGSPPEDAKQGDLSDFPFNIVRYKIDWKDRSVTGSVLGLARKKAVFRKGLGSTLVNGLGE